MSEPLIPRLARVIAQLPGLGPRSSHRIALRLCQEKSRHTLLYPLIDALSRIDGNIHTCSLCGNLDETEPCSLCQDPNRDRSALCVVQELESLLALEKSKSYRGLYHVLGGTLSSLKGVGPEDLRLEALTRRLSGVKEVILALNATVDGQTTSYMILEMLRDHQNNGLKVSQIARGVPLGGELGYLDEETLAMALKIRQPF